MKFARRLGGSSRSLLAFGLLLFVLCVAGGASRADALGQAVVRTAAFVILAAIAGGLLPIDGRKMRAPLLIVGLSIALVAIQLVPLPPGLWRNLPGRAMLHAITVTAGVSEVWRPIAIVPDAGLNAMFSLAVPLCALLLLSGVDDGHLRSIRGMVLLTVLVSAAVATVQVVSPFDNPFINETVGEASGIFANRNHQALFLAMGILLSFSWGFDRGANERVRASLAVGCTTLFLLLILVTGSRAGLLLALIAVLYGLASSWGGVTRLVRRLPRPTALIAVAAVIGGIAAVAILSIVGDRAESINRLMALSAETDFRRKALPVVVDMIGAYFPVGSGFGSFDPVFRIAEPAGILALTYFNHAHNDFVEVALEGGAAGIALLIGAILWVGRKSYPGWARASADAAPFARDGGGLIVLLLVASLSDYPARTPVIMTVIAVAARFLVAQAAHETRIRGVAG